MERFEIVARRNMLGAEIREKIRQFEVETGTFVTFVDVRRDGRTVRHVAVQVEDVVPVAPVPAPVSTTTPPPAPVNLPGQAVKP